MANFKEHLVYGVGVSSICSITGYWQFGLTEVQSIASFILGSLASLAPDIDHPDGIPGEILSEILIALAPITLSLYFFPKYFFPKYNIHQFNIEHWIVVFCVVYLIIKYSCLYLIPKLTVHRGIFHSLPAGIICAEIVFLLFPHVPLANRITIAAIAMLGYVTHLIVDEIYGVDWKKLESKKSSGSALDLGLRHGFSSLLVYFLILVLAGIIWYQYQPDPIHTVLYYFQK